MPKVSFLNEAVSLDAQAGKTLLDLAKEADVNLFRGFWKSYHCGGRGLCPGAGCRVWVTELAEGALTPKTLREKLHFMLRGSTLRLACQAHLQGECEVRTQPGSMLEQADNMKWDPDPAPSRWQDRLIVRPDKKKKAAAPAKGGKAAAPAAAVEADAEGDEAAEDEE